MPASPIAPVARRSRDNEKPLIEDIRLLGRLLGDVIREQEGPQVFELVEKIRKLSVAFRRDADHEADRALKSLLKSLPSEDAVRVIRAFTYFSHLANLAEDRHHIRRRVIHERAGDTHEGSIEVALARLRWAGISPRAIAQTLANSYVSPVLTAHPTEVQRKSILDAERDIARLLTERDEIKARALPKDALAPRELAANEAQLRARVMQLWQTRLLRFSKLTVADEIENALSYYEATFLREIPRLYADMERELGPHRVASFLRMGMWIGGDRDGNPNVTAGTLDHALRRQCEVALRHYLTEVHHLGAELSLSAMLVDVTPAMRALATASPDTNSHRQDEPYRRALAWMYARLAASLHELTGGEAAHRLVLVGAPHLAVQQALSWGQVPVLLGGDHSLAIGSVAAVARHCATQGKRLQLVWFDAHADSNTPATSPSGHLHGMPLACLLGQGPVELTRPEPVLRPEQVWLLGLRSTDPGEEALLQSVSIRPVRLQGGPDDGWQMVATLAQWLTDLDPQTHVHLSLDLDVLDPGLAPGVSTPVPGGLNAEQAMACMRWLGQCGLVGSVDLMELNPARDVNQQTARLAVALLTQLLAPPDQNTQSSAEVISR